MKKKLNNGERFIKERKKSMKELFAFLKPKIHYDKDYDILYLGFAGNSKCYGTVEATNDLRFDVSKDGTIIGIEIENFSHYQKKGEFALTNEGEKQ